MLEVSTENKTADLQTIRKLNPELLPQMRMLDIHCLTLLRV